MELGKFYSVPHVRARWGHNAPKWWPVMGPAHSDSEIIKFEPVHWHVDFRFLNKTDRVSLVSPMFGRPLHDVFAVTISWVSPEGITIACQDQDHDHILGQVAVGTCPKKESRRSPTCGPSGASSWPTTRPIRLGSPGWVLWRTPTKATG